MHLIWDVSQGESEEEKCDDTGELIFAAIGEIPRQDDISLDHRKGQRGCSFSQKPETMQMFAIQTVWNLHGCSANFVDVDWAEHWL